MGNETEQGRRQSLAQADKDASSREAAFEAERTAWTNERRLLEERAKKAAADALASNKKAAAKERLQREKERAEAAKKKQEAEEEAAKVREREDSAWKDHMEGEAAAKETRIQVLEAELRHIRESDKVSAV